MSAALVFTLLLLSVLTVQPFSCNQKQLWWRFTDYVRKKRCLESLEFFFSLLGSWLIMKSKEPRWRSHLNVSRESFTAQRDTLAPVCVNRVNPNTHLTHGTRFHVSEVVSFLFIQRHRWALLTHHTEFIFVFNEVQQLWGTLLLIAFLLCQGEEV